LSSLVTDFHLERRRRDRALHHEMKRAPHEGSCPHATRIDIAFGCRLQKALPTDGTIECRREFLGVVAKQVLLLPEHSFLGRGLEHVGWDQRNP